MRLPRTGTWRGEPGNSFFVLDDEARITVGKGDTKVTVTGKQIKEKYEIEGIEYNNREPMFDELADQIIGGISVPVMPDNRSDSYSMAIEGAKMKTGKNGKEIKQYMEEHSLTWHECTGRSIIFAVPTELNAAFPHTGGIGIQRGKLRRQDKVKKLFGDAEVEISPGPEIMLVTQKKRT